MRRAAGIILIIALFTLPIAYFLSQRAGGWSQTAGAVGLVELTGTISDLVDDTIGGSGGIRPLLDALADARRDDRVAAVVVRINSGGGSAAASQEIHRAIQKVKKAGKPVVVSMGDAAASGAYYAAVAGDRILANPATITGSIGVFIQFLKAPKLAEKYGVKLETVKTGPYKDIGNPTQPLTDDGRAVLQSVVEDSLDQFVAAVAAGRNLQVEEVRKIADGRILTGRQAQKLGLIDDFGGLEDAVNLAASLAGVEGEPKIIRYMKPPPWYARLLRVAVHNRLESEATAQLLRQLLNPSTELRVRY